MARKPNAKQEPEISKTPRKPGFDENPYRLRPAWRVGQMEMCDPFGWREIDGKLLLEIREKLKSFESMKLSEIIGKDNHPVEVSRLCKRAQDRLDELHLDDIEQLLSLHLTGPKRVWGILEHNVVILLWWDPNHEICPSLKKHT